MPASRHFLRRAAMTVAAMILLAGLTAPLHAGTADTTRADSGLVVIVARHGTGRMPASGEVVIVHYVGRLSDGTVFDESRKRNEPFAFALGQGQVIKGWDLGIAMLRIGDSARLVIPAPLAYGERGAGGGRIPPNAELTFDVELLDIKSKTVGGEITNAITKNGIGAARKLFAKMKAAKFAGYYMSESDMNAAGYRLLQAGKTADAIAVFAMNVEMFPKSGNVYDSLGEACMTAGDRKKAIANYEHSLELDPSNENAKEMLKKLRQ